MALSIQDERFRTFALKQRKGLSQRAGESPCHELNRENGKSCLARERPKWLGRSPRELTHKTPLILYGLNAGIINKTQFSLLVTVVVLSAIVPTAIAQRFFQPHAEQEHERDRAEAGAPTHAVPAGEGAPG